MERAFAGLLLLIVGTTAWAGDPCSGKVAASILAHDRNLRQGAGLLINHCGRPLRAAVVIHAVNHDGFGVARLRTEVQAGPAPLSVIRVDLPFVQSTIRLSGYTTEIAAIETLDTMAAHDTRSVAKPGPTPAL